MSTRLMLCIALGIQSAFTLAHSANDLEKWNSERGVQVRQETKQQLSTTYSEKSSNVVHKDSSYNSNVNNGKVVKQIETKASVGGSRVGVTIEAFKEVDKSSAAKRFAENFAKGLGRDMFKQGVRLTAGGILIDAALDEMIEGIGWVIDEGGKVKRLNDQTNDLYPKSQYLYSVSYNVTYSPLLPTHAQTCQYIIDNDRVFQDGNTFTGTYTLDYITTERGIPLYECNWPIKSGGSYSVQVITHLNPNYDPSYEPSYDAVSEAEMIQKIREYFENPQSPPSKDILLEQAEKPQSTASIQWSDDPSSKQTIYSDNKNTAEKVLESNDPKGEGKTKETPKIVDSTEVDSSSTSDTTGTNTSQTMTDPVTGQTTTITNVTNNTVTNNNLKLPSFCEYMMKLCEWIDWTQEQPEKEQEEEKPDINYQGIFDREFDIKFELEKNCPPDKPINFETKYIAGTYLFKFNWLCIFFNGIAYPLVFLSNCLGIWIFYEITVRRGNQGS